MACMLKNVNTLGNSQRKKYKASWDYYAKMNKFEEGFEYTEAFS